MAGSKKKTSPSQDSNYDGPWKAFVRNHFELFLKCFFPELSAFIDWRIPPVFDPTEVSQFLGKSKSRNRFVDMVIQVARKDGRTQLLLLHLEIQTKFSKTLARRLFKLNSGLEWHFWNADVASLVLRTDLAKKWSKTVYALEIGDFSRRVEFPTCKISDKLEHEWVNDFSLPVMVARAQIEALRTTSDDNARFAAKKELMRQLYLGKYTRDEVLEILRFVDWMMHLRDDLEEQLRKEIREFKSEVTPEMTEYVTSWERMAKAEGKAEGILESVLKILDRFCGKLPKKIKLQISDLPGEELARLLDDSLDFTSQDDLTKWLAGDRD